MEKIQMKKIGDSIRLTMLLIIISLLLILVCGLNCAIPNNTHFSFRETKPIEYHSFVLYSLDEKEYSDSIKVLVTKDDECRTIGMFIGLGYRLSSIEDVIRESLTSPYIEERYMVFVK
jgi:hypothetical protein